MINDRFKLFVNFELLDNIDQEDNKGLLEVAKVRNLTKKEDVMYVLYDKDNIYKSKYTMFTTIIDSRWVAIMKDEALYRFKKNVNNFAFSIFHELGHFLNGDYDESIQITTKEISQVRKEMIEKGQVIDMELKADEFAVKQVGKSKAINDLDYSINRRKLLDNSADAIRELELRKKHIKNMII